MAKELVWQLWPLDAINITGRFGQDYGGYLHRGVDLGVMNGDYGMFVYAPADGEAVEPTNNGSYGIAVCLDHLETPYYSLYAHLSEAFVSPGASVRAGQVIGRMGFTGKVDPPGKAGTHLHWQVCKSRTFPTDISQSVDPLLIPFAHGSGASGAQVDEASIERVVEKVLDKRKMESNFAEAMTGRIKAIHDATDGFLDERVQLQRIHLATDLANPAFNIV